MNDRKQHVIRVAHELFIEKGFQATSIQDILDASKISKGTFYNYFSSKNELFIALFTSLFQQVEQERNELLIGHDREDVAVFIKQIELQLTMNRKNKLIPLFEEVIVSHDEELKRFIQKGQLKILRWYYGRFLDLFGPEKEPYLLDCAIMFMGILHQNLKFYSMAHNARVDIHEVVQYSVGRLVKMVEEVASAGDQLLDPAYLKRWLPEKNSTGSPNFGKKLAQVITALKAPLSQKVVDDRKREGLNELLDFIQEELQQPKKPRRFLIQSALTTLHEKEGIFELEQLEELEKLVENRNKLES
ncbi:AcrR family transcriptional regulator [Evansella vedderi]|uniref:AcrR family transcriptional regulator n=1 Tax=Evansella vedderi TaxID=38282 RepID=A0ABT9ZP78_9BACI|nr:TetR/AcrR family transcriptional regulator [Evansella vedderi]MDQ0252654.1 AcrR family transcriptional regulator [Evansella vedderi]